jgi:octaprenyl-diphosphate synthase
METRTLDEQDLQRILRLMQEYGSITYAMDRAQAFVDAAKRELELFDDCLPRRALAVTADYMVTRDR